MPRLGVDRPKHRAEHGRTGLIAAMPLSRPVADARPAEGKVFNHPTPPDSPGLAPIKDRRAPAGATGAAAWLRRLRSLLARPLRLQRQDGRLRLVLVDRRQARPADGLPSLTESRDELRALLLVHGNEQATGVMRHLVLVHHELGRRGWPGVEALPGPVLNLALAQAEMLASDESSEALGMIIERLRLAKVAAELREERPPHQAPEAIDQAPEVSEVPRDKFDEWARDDWVDTSPPSDVNWRRARGERQG
jgi:hypothetical protein